MPPESDFTRNLLKEIRQHPDMRAAVVYKHNDFYTAGIPDFSISMGLKTTWWEVKVEPNAPTKLQQIYLEKLSPGSYIITKMKDKRIKIERVGGSQLFALSVKEAAERVVQAAFA